MEGMRGGHRHWECRRPVVVGDDLFREVGGHPLVAERLVRQGMTDLAEVRAFLDPGHYIEASPFELPDLEVAVARIDRALRTAEPILIWGDFDVDGQTATALLVTALRRRGAPVEVHIPQRDGEGHGIYLPRLREWLARGVRGPRGTALIITCDTGIGAHEAVEVARAAGVDVIITDHHLPGITLPAALAVINPLRLPEGHRLRDLPGVGVAYELMRGLGGEEASRELLDLVALGIVADVTVQRNETRYLLQCGIEALRLTVRPGLRALIDVAGLSAPELDEADIAVGLVPRLNAPGRMGDARECVELLVTEDAGRAAELASQLEGMNARRKLEARLVAESAAALLERDPSMLEYAAIVLAHPDWNGGIVGVVAKRLAEQYRRPVVLLGERNGLLAGSARSVAGCNVTEALADCADLLVRYGGHPMAAGLSLPATSLLDFRRRFSGAVRARMAEDLAQSEESRRSIREPMLEIDGELGLAEITPGLVADLRRLGPFGNGNPALTLVTRDLRLVRHRKLGRRGDRLDMLVEDPAGHRQRVLCQRALWEKAIPDGRFSLAYHLALRRLRGQAEVVLEAIDLMPAEPQSIDQGSGEAAVEPRQGHQGRLVEDYRQDHDPAGRLAEILAREPQAIVWSEDDSTVVGLRRDQLVSAPTLVIWTTPPGPLELEAALARVGPTRIILFNQPPVAPTVTTFLQRLGGVIRYVLRTKRGETSIQELGGVLAQRDDAIRYGLKWFEASGRIALEIDRAGEVKLKRFDGAGTVSPARLEARLRACLEETAAYRRLAVGWPSVGRRMAVRWPH